MNKVYLVTWVDENDACVEVYSTPKLALDSLPKYVNVLDVQGIPIESWDGEGDLDIYTTPKSDRRYQLQSVTVK